MRSSRVLLITILATGALYVASFVALGSGYPTAESTGDEIVSWFTDNGSKARIYAWTAAFVSLGLGIFGGQMSALFPRPHRYIFFAGVLGFAITAQVQAWFWTGLRVSAHSQMAAVVECRLLRRASHRDHHGVRGIRVHRSGWPHERVSRRRHRIRVGRGLVCWAVKRLDSAQPEDVAAA
jgi:hypothetical protein